jgi:hypothetical protein
MTTISKSIRMTSISTSKAQGSRVASHAPSQVVPLMSFPGSWHRGPACVSRIVRSITVASKRLSAGSRWITASALWALDAVEWESKARFPGAPGRLAAGGPGTGCLVARGGPRLVLGLRLSFAGRSRGQRGSEATRSWRRTLSRPVAVLAAAAWCARTWACPAVAMQCGARFRSDRAGDGAVGRVGGSVEVVCGAPDLAAGRAADRACASAERVRGRPRDVRCGFRVGGCEPPHLGGAVTGEADDVGPDDVPLGRTHRGETPADARGTPLAAEPGHGQVLGEVPAAVPLENHRARRRGRGVPSGGGASEGSGRGRVSRRRTIPAGWFPLCPQAGRPRSR